MEPVPGEPELSASMVKFAEIFRRASARAGEPIGWDTASALRLDDLCATYLAITPDQESIQRMTRVIGAYLGELIVRNGGGKWVWDTEVGAPGVQTPHGPRCFPLAKVHKRLTIGQEHSLWIFYDIAMTGRIPPDVKVSPRERPGPPTDSGG